MLTVASCASETLSPFGYFFSSSSARTVRPASVVVAAMRLDDRAKNCAGFAAPVDADERKSRCSIYSLTGSSGKWHTVIGNLARQPVFGVQSSTDGRDKPFDPPPVSGHQQTLGFRITFLSHGLPPAADGVNRKGGGVVIRSHADPAGIVVDVINAVRHRAFQLGINEVMYIDLFGLPLGLHSRPAFLKLPTNSFFFVSTEMTGLAVRQKNLPAFLLMYSN